jgi:hypothetical protein
MCFTHTQPTAIPDQMSPLPQSTSTSDQSVTNNTNPLAMVLQRNGIDPSNVGVQKPTFAGRAAELATGGAYDPTAGGDFGKFDPNPGSSGGGRLTKWGALAKLVEPMLQGGVIGWAGGKGTPGGGFNAANNHFQQQRAMQMQYALLARQLQNDQFRNALEFARTQHTLQQPNFNGRGAAPIKGKDENGNLIYMRPNPQTGVYEKVQGITPDETDNSKLEWTDQGLVSANPRAATARRVTLPLLPAKTGQPNIADAQPGPDGSAPSSIPTKAPTQFDSSGLQLPGTGTPTGTASQSPSGIVAASSAGAIPLRPSGFSTPKPTVRASRNAAGVETDSIYDTNPNSPTFGKQIGRTGNTRQPLPDRAVNRDNARNAQKADDVSRSETYAAAALAKSGNDPDKAISYLSGLKFGDPNTAKDFARLLPQIRKSITDRTKSRKPKAKNPFGLDDQTWQQLTQPNQPDENDEQ